MQHHIDGSLNQCKVYLEFFHFNNFKLEYLKHIAQKGGSVQTICSFERPGYV